MPSPNLIAAALSQRTSRGKIVILGSLLPLHLNPLRVAEEYAMLDNMCDGRLIAGFAPGSGPETFNYDVPSPVSRQQFWEAVDLIHRSWTQDGPFAAEGRHYPLRYVNPWPRPTQQPHPPIWIPSSRSTTTLRQIAKRGYSYFLSSRSHGSETARAQQQFAKVLEEHGGSFNPFRMGILMSAYVGETDKQAQAEAKEGVWYFLRNCLKGHLRREGRQLTFGAGIPYFTTDDYRAYLAHTDPTKPLLGDAETWDDLQRSQSIVVGSAETVHRRILEILEQAPVGHLLIQFHLGNMDDALTRKSMHRFVTEVAPRLREDSARLFGSRFPDAERTRTPEMAK